MKTTFKPIKYKYVGNKATVSFSLHDMNPVEVKQNQEFFVTSKRGAEQLKEDKRFKVIK